MFLNVVVFLSGLVLKRQRHRSFPHSLNQTGMSFLCDLEFAAYRHATRVYNENVQLRERALNQAKAEHDLLVARQLVLAAERKSRDSVEARREFNENSEKHKKILERIAELQRPVPGPPIHPMYHPEHIRIDELLEQADVYWWEEDNPEKLREINAEIALLTKKIQEIDNFWRDCAMPNNIRPAARVELATSGL